MPGALGASAPGSAHLVAALLRRVAPILALVAVLAVSASALGSGRDIIADFQDNGRIDGCYTLAEFQQALRLANGDQQQYGALIDVLRAAEVTNVRRPGQRCPQAAQTAPADAGAGSSSSGSTLAWVGVGLAAAALAVGVGALVRRRRSRPPADGSA